MAFANHQRAKLQNGMFKLCENAAWLLDSYHPSSILLASSLPFAAASR